MHHCRVGGDCLRKTGNAMSFGIKICSDCHFLAVNFGIFDRYYPPYFSCFLFKLKQPAFRVWLCFVTVVMAFPALCNSVQIPSYTAVPLQRTTSVAVSPERLLLWWQHCLFYSMPWSVWRSCVRMPSAVTSPWRMLQKFSSWLTSTARINWKLRQWISSTSE